MALTATPRHREGHRSWRRFSSICRRAICNAGSVTRSPSTWTPCAIRAAPRTSARRCGSSTPAGTDGRPSPRWRCPAPRSADCDRRWAPRRCSEWPTATAVPPTSGGSSRWSGLHRVGADLAELMTSYFELTELHIAPRAQGRGLGEALARRLLADRGESHVLLSTPEINGEANRAWRLYRRLGFTDIIRGYHFAGDPRAFAILGRALPLLTPTARRVWHDDHVRAAERRTAYWPLRCCCCCWCRWPSAVCGSGHRSPCRPTTRCPGRSSRRPSRAARGPGPAAAQLAAVRQQGRGIEV